jgi:gingipain R
MKKLTCLVVCLLFVSLTFVLPGNVKVKKNKPKLISHSDIETVITFPVDTYKLEYVLTPNGEEVVVNAPHSGRIMKKGAPDLVRLSSSLIIPDKGKMKVEVIDTQFIELENIKVAPSRGNLPRTVDPDQVPYEYGKEYKKNAFFPGNSVELNKPYIARDFRGQTVLFYPFQYNPVTGTLRVYTEITVRVDQVGAAGKNEFDRKKPLRFEELDSEFQQVYSRHFINFDAMSRLEASEASLQYTPLKDPRGRMLIVCYNGFMTNMWTW